MDEEKEWKRKVDLPFIKVRESDEEKYVEVGPIVVHRKGEQEKVTFFGDETDKWKASGRLWKFGVALFLLLVGVVLTIQNLTTYRLDGVIEAGTGLLLLALSMVRMIMKLKVSPFWSVVGAALLIDGVGEFLGYDMPTIPLLLILIGIWMIIKTIG
jgi:hypothetical protein